MTAAKKELPVHSNRTRSGELWQLAEKLDSSREKERAKFEYQCMGFRVACELAGPRLWYVWLGPERRRKPRLLEGERIRRMKSR